MCVALCLAASSSAEKIKLGDIETFHHGAGGEVFALDEKTLMIKDFTYDGAGKWGREGTFTLYYRLFWFQAPMHFSGLAPRAPPPMFPMRPRPRFWLTLMSSLDTMSTGTRAPPSSGPPPRNRSPSGSPRTWRSATSSGSPSGAGSSAWTLETSSSPQTST